MAILFWYKQIILTWPLVLHKIWIPFTFLKICHIIRKPVYWSMTKTNKMTCLPSKDTDQHGHLPSLISLRYHMCFMDSYGPNAFLG